MHSEGEGESGNGLPFNETRTRTTMHNGRKDGWLAGWLAVSHASLVGQGPIKQCVYLKGKLEGKPLDKKLLKEQIKDKGTLLLTGCSY